MYRVVKCSMMSTFHAGSRQGSIVVIYGMEITKAAAADTVKYVSSGISKNKGTFVGYTVDVNSLKWAGENTHALHHINSLFCWTNRRKCTCKQNKSLNVQPVITYLVTGTVQVT